MEEILLKIMENLYIGDNKASMSKSSLQLKNITHILCVGKEMVNFFKKDFTIMKLDVLDSEDEDILNDFEIIYNFIEEGREKGGILIHCYGAISRSPTIIIAYLIKKLKIPLEEAYNIVKSIKSDINPNEGFISKLKDFEKTIIKRLENIFKCSICRKNLFDDTSLNVEHEFTPKKKYSYKRYKKSFVNTNECSSYFLDHASFVNLDDEIGGKINCPHPNVC